MKNTVIQLLFNMRGEMWMWEKCHGDITFCDTEYVYTNNNVQIKVLIITI